MYLNRKNMFEMIVKKGRKRMYLAYSKNSASKSVSRLCQISANSNMMGRESERDTAIP
jgi:hypothetical protein